MPVSIKLVVDEARLELVFRGSNGSTSRSQELEKAVSRDDYVQVFLVSNPM